MKGNGPVRLASRIKLLTLKLSDSVTYKKYNAVAVYRPLPF